MADATSAGVARLQQQREAILRMVRAKQQDVVVAPMPASKPARQTPYIATGAAAVGHRIALVSPRVGRAPLKSPRLVRPGGGVLPFPAARTRPRPPMLPVTAVAPGAAGGGNAKAQSRPVVIGVTARQLCLFMMMTIVAGILSAEFIVLRHTLFEEQRSSAEETAVLDAYSNARVHQHLVAYLHRATAGESGGERSASDGELRGSIARAVAHVAPSLAWELAPMIGAPAKPSQPRDATSWRNAVGVAKHPNEVLLQLSSRGLRFTTSGVPELLRPTDRASNRWWAHSTEVIVTPLTVVRAISKAGVPPAPRLVEIDVDASLDVARALIVGSEGKWRPLFILVRFSACVPPPVRLHFPFNPSATSDMLLKHAALPKWSDRCTEGAGFPRSSISAWENELKAFDGIDYCPVAMLGESALFSRCRLKPRGANVPFVQRWTHAKKHSFACAFKAEFHSPEGNDDGTRMSLNFSPIRAPSEAPSEGRTFVAQRDWNDDAAPLLERIESIRNATKEYLEATTRTAVTMGDMRPMDLHKNGRDVRLKGREVTVALSVSDDAHRTLTYDHCPYRPAWH